MSDGDLQKVLERLRRIEAMAASSHGERIWSWIIKGGIPVLLATVVTLIGFGASLNTRVTVIESNRFTAGDAAKLREKILQELPPSWLREDLAEIKERLKRLEERVK